MELFFCQNTLKTYFFGGARRKQLDIVPFVPRDSSWQENGIVFRVVLKEPDDVLYLFIGQGVVWKLPLVAMCPCS